MTTDRQSALETLQTLLKTESTEQSAAPGAPFGLAVKRCLDDTIDAARALGFDAIDADGYCGYTEWNVGAAETVGVLTHLDVVPVGKGWTRAQGEIADGKIYGRGTTDDKGPTVACLYALKNLQASGFRPRRNIRLIWGCNEETGNRCMDYYAAHFKMPDIGFSPDGDFPYIGCEKSIIHASVTVDAPDALKAFTAGARPNVVPDEAVITLTATDSTDTVGAQTQPNADGTQTLVYAGTAAHAMKPHAGDNAVWKAAAYLRASLPVSAEDTPYARLLTLASECCLDILGIDCTDERSGSQTVNIGVVRLENGQLTFTFDFRCPIPNTLDIIMSSLEDYVGVKPALLNHTPYLYADRNGELAAKLSEVYTRMTGRSAEPIICGGGTYARRMPYGVAFGPQLADVDNHIHDKDEFIDLAHFYALIDIYQEAMKALSE